MTEAGTAQITKVSIFFYGTFMSASILREFGIDVAKTFPARILDFELTIRPRVNLERRANAITFGGTTSISHRDIGLLYDGLQKEFGIQYLPYPVTTIGQNGETKPALCYVSVNIADADANPAYLDSLAQCARGIGAPQSYIDHIYSFG